MKVNNHTKSYRILIKIINIILPVLNNKDEEGFYLEDEIFDTILQNSIYTNKIEKYVRTKYLAQAQE